MPVTETPCRVVRKFAKVEWIVTSAHSLPSHSKAEGYVKMEPYLTYREMWTCLLCKSLSLGGIGWGKEMDGMGRINSLARNRDGKMPRNPSITFHP